MTLPWFLGVLSRCPRALAGPPQVPGPALCHWLCPGCTGAGGGHWAFPNPNESSCGPERKVSGGRGVVAARSRQTTSSCAAGWGVPGLGPTVQGERGWSQMADPSEWAVGRGGGRGHCQVPHTSCVRPWTRVSQSVVQPPTDHCLSGTWVQALQKCQSSRRRGTQRAFMWRGRDSSEEMSVGGTSTQCDAPSMEPWPARLLRQFLLQKTWPQKPWGGLSRKDKQPVHACRLVCSWVFVCPPLAIQEVPTRAITGPPGGRAGLVTGAMVRWAHSEATLRAAFCCG